MQKISLILILTFLFPLINCFSQPTIQWAKNFGGSNTDFANDIKQTPDGGYIAVGYTYSNDSDVVGNKGLGDCWIIKLNAMGNVQWKKCYGGSGGEEGFSIVLSNDGGYVVAAYTDGIDGDVVNRNVHGTNKNADFWIFKIDSLGNIVWSKCYGGSYQEFAYSIINTNDDGFLVLGYVESSDGDITDHHSSGMAINGDFWLLKLDSSGNKIWAKSYGGSGVERGQALVKSLNNTYYLAGSSDFANYDVLGNNGRSDFWVVKIDSIGGIIWRKILEVHW